MIGQKIQVKNKEKVILVAHPTVDKSSHPGELRNQTTVAGQRRKSNKGAGRKLKSPAGNRNIFASDDSQAIDTKVALPDLDGVP